MEQNLFQNLLNLWDDITSSKKQKNPLVDECPYSTMSTGDPIDSIEDQSGNLESFTDSFADFGSICEGNTSILVQPIPPSSSKPATQLPKSENLPDPRHINQTLWEAAEKNRVDILESLKMIPGINYNAQGLNDYTPLHFSANEGHIEATTFLLKSGANPDMQNYMERTPTHLAAIRGHLPIIMLLVQYKSDINAKDIDSNTPIHYASEHGYARIVEWLLATRGINIEIRNRMGKRPGEIASTLEVAALFRRYEQRFQDRLPRYVKTRSHHTIEIADVQPQRGVSALDFDPISELGKGSFGEVYLVRKRDTRELYAMKVLRKDKIIGQNLVKYALTERNVLSYIKHPFIVSLDFAFQNPEKLFLILEYAPKGDLSFQLRRVKRFTEEVARLYICEVVLALEALHREDIIYRDLKPDNVVIDNEGHALLTDFGLSKHGIQDNTTAKSFCGSVAYLAPEMIRRQGHGKGVDWYLLGILLYEMLVGIPPYYSPNKEQLFHNILRGKLKMPMSLSGEVKDLLKGLLQRDPQKRLGAGRRDADEIKEHAFFNGINWEDVAQRKLRMPQFEGPKPSYTKISREAVFGMFSKPGDPANRIAGWTFVSENIETVNNQ